MVTWNNVSIVFGFLGVAFSIGIWVGLRKSESELFKRLEVKVDEFDTKLDHKIDDIERRMIASLKEQDQLYVRRDFFTVRIESLTSEIKLLQALIVRTGKEGS